MAGVAACFLVDQPIAERGDLLVLCSELFAGGEEVGDGGVFAAGGGENDIVVVFGWSWK